MLSPSSPSPAKLLYSLPGHTNEVTTLAFTPDRGLLAAGSRDGTGRIWNIGSSTPAEIATFKLAGEGVRSLAFSPNSRVLAAGTSTNLISLYDVSSAGARLIRVLRGGRGSINALAFSPDGKLVAGGGEDQMLRVWELSTGTSGEARNSLPGHTRSIRDVEFSSDGTGLATASSDGSARVWALTGIRPGQRLNLPHVGEVFAATYSPDGKILATVGQDKSIRLWDLKALKQTPQASLTDLSGATRLVMIAKDGETLVSVNDSHQAINWNLRTGQPSQRWEMPEGRTVGVALTRDGRYLARGMADGAVEIYRVAEKRS